MDTVLNYINNLSIAPRLAVFAGIAVATHLVVIVVRQATHRAMLGVEHRRHQKLRSVGTLASSAIVFALYFFAIGLILHEFGVSLTAYLASASVIGLAIGFGSQGIVQDVVTGLTLLFSDLVDVGDLVEISGQTGVVKAITMRFVELENALGATVFIPNRTINNVINYPRGYIRCIVDVTLRGEDTIRDAIEQMTIRLMNTIHGQFRGIFIFPPSSEGRMSFGEDKQVLRLKFRIWPNRGQPIESAFSNELTALITQVDPDYKPWMVTISYEVEKPQQPAAGQWLRRKKN